MLAFRRNDEGTLAIVDRRLVGVAYYQTAADDAGYRHVIGHGPRSLYDQLFPEIEALGAPQI
jgi:hypothetical protein